ncbi:MAG TPA: RES domain-containing protein [Dehalococcoidia bacterium]|nr:RES domain-containing protein [Dehalococcoidia bacterium]
MALDDQLHRWHGAAYRHIPHGSGFDVLDFRFAGRSADNRWNAAGEPTLSLAGDLATAIAEFARHFQVLQSPQLGPFAVERQVYRLELRLELLDLREPAVLEALSLAGAPQRFLDRAVARATARFVRRTTAAQAIIVPSMVFLDQPDRWILVVFLECLPADPRRFISSAVADTAFRLTAADLEPPR